MRIIQRDVDPSSFNLEFYDDQDRNDCVNYLGTLKLNKRDWQHLKLMEILSNNDLIPVKYEAVKYILMEGRK